MGLTEFRIRCMTTEPENLSQDGEELLAEEKTSNNSHLSAEEQLAIAREELEESRREASQTLDAAQRAHADLINYRRRTDEERIELGKFANSRLISKLLPVLEELNLAVTHAEGGSPNSSWVEGVKLIQRKLANLLQAEGLTDIETVGTMFNPVEHEALGTEETTEYLPGYVTSGVRPGYRLHGRVIQPAQVMVAREPAKTDITNDSKESKENEDG